MRLGRNQIRSVAANLAGGNRIGEAVSIPVRASDGCVIGSRLNRVETIPFYLRAGATVEKALVQCPVHTRKRWETEIVTPWGRVIGTLTKQERGGVYISVHQHKDRLYFIGKYVFCDEHKEWHHWR